MTAKHIHGPTCALCLIKLDQTHPDLVRWFFAVKVRFKDAHISWGFRGKIEQDQMLKDKLSKLAWPNSKHNFMENGRPASNALDLFQLSTNGVAVYNYGWFAQIEKEFGHSPYSIRWGGTFKSLGDYCHFELT